MNRGAPAILVLLSALVWPWFPVAAGPVEGTKASVDLPPVECVRMLRWARAKLEQGDEQGGARLLRETVDQFPGEVVALIALWDFHRQFGLPEEEAVRLRGILTHRLADPRSSLPPGVLRYLIRRPDAGKEELELLLTAANARLKDDDLEMIRTIAYLQTRLELFEDSRETYGKLRDLAPSAALDWTCVLLDIDLERWADAAEGLESVVAAKGTSIISRLMYIDVLSRLGRYDEMLRQIDHLSSNNTLMTEFLNDILADSAWNLRDAGKDREAEAVFKRILAADPKNQEALAATLYLYGSEEELQAHRAALQSAREEETEPDKLAEQGGNLLAAGDAEQAFELLDRASRSLADEEIVWFNLGLAALKLERWEAAQRALLQATKINPERAESFLNRAIALQKIGRCAEAIEALKRTLKLTPERTDAYYYVYACHVELGNTEAAQEALRRYNAR